MVSRFVAVSLALLTGCATVARADAPKRFAENVIDIGDVAEGSLGPVLKKFDERIAAGDKLITFRINSYGGSVDDGLDFIQHVEDAKKTSGAHVQCVVDEKAMSMGFIILQSPACDERLMTKRSRLLAHKAATKVAGNAEELEETLASLKATDEALAEIAAARLRISVARYRAKVAHGDWMMASQEALDVGAVDGFVDPTDIPAPYKLEESDVGGLLRKLLGG